MKNLSIGIIGIGNMGQAHARSIRSGLVPRARLTAVCDSGPSAAERFPDIPCFSSVRDLVESGTVEAVIVATPHFSHTTVGMETLRAGLHVLVEKPISVHKADCERLIAARRSPEQVFAAMFNMRTQPVYRKLRQLIQSGELGTLRRVQWTVTNWFRSSAYYASGSWRATWSGEGGGVLLNQCPHQLDLWQWLFGMPRKVHAFCHMGRYHDIAVEDDVTAYLEYANGMTGLFVTSTGEYPGTNRLEIAAERGRIVLEDGRLFFNRTEIPVSEHSRTTREFMQGPPVWNIEIPLETAGNQHVEILRNFAEAILDGARLVAPGEEGIYSVELANAMLHSTFTGSAVNLPLDSAAYEKALHDRILAETGAEPALSPAA